MLSASSAEDRTPNRPERRATVALGLLLCALMTMLVPLGAAQAATKPTVVLAHGAWSTPASWDRIAPRLRSLGFPVVTPTNGLRSLGADVAGLTGVLAGIRGPIVVVGHSYGGSVMTNAAANNPNVKALIYVAALAPDINESLLGLLLSQPGTRLLTALETELFLNSEGIGLDTRISKAQFRDVFAGDVAPEVAGALADSQKKTSLYLSLEPTTKTAWRGIPSWFLIPQNDQLIPAELQRTMARRAGSTVLQTPGSHAIMFSNPGLVTTLINTVASKF
ncbi:MAG: alpha/beta fold hydrolase [Actinomycetota bacterium]